MRSNTWWISTPSHKSSYSVSFPESSRQDRNYEIQITVRLNDKTIKSATHKRNDNLKNEFNLISKVLIILNILRVLDIGRD